MLQHACNQEEVKLKMTLTNSYFSGMCDVLVTASSSAKAAPRELLAPGLFYLIFFEEEISPELMHFYPGGRNIFKGFS